MNTKEELDWLFEQWKNRTQKPMTHNLPPQSLKEKLQLTINDQPLSMDQMRSFIADYLDHSVDTSRLEYCNQLWSKTEEASLLGEILSSLTNTSMYTYEVAPVATLLETTMRDHLSHRVWGKKGDGIMTSGGTASNLQALMTARNLKLKAVKEKGIAALEKQPLIFAADNAHYSIKRSLNILGLGQDHLITVPTNQYGQMEAQTLRSLIVEKRNSGLQPFCVVSTAGTTVEGAYDQLEDIGTVCKEFDLWFHVDGAYGGSALMSSTHKALLKGLNQADSFAWDFHKMLGVHLPCAFLFTQHRGALAQSITSGNDSYLFHDDDNIDLGPSSLQCGRRNDILKLWLTWQYYGAQGIEQRVDRLFEQAQVFAEKIKHSDHFDLIQQPQSINVCFRAKGLSKVEPIRDILKKRGTLLINYSHDQQGEFFRMAFTNPRFKEEDLDHMLSSIQEAVHELN